MNTTSSGATALAEPAVQEFAASLRGSVLRPGETAFDAARKVWNGIIDRSPALIARCAGAADVICAVNLARDRGLKLPVAGGGRPAAPIAITAVRRPTH